MAQQLRLFATLPKDPSSVLVSMSSSYLQDGQEALEDPQLNIWGTIKMLERKSLVID